MVVFTPFDSSWQGAGLAMTQQNQVALTLSVTPAKRSASRVHSSAAATVDMESRLKAEMTGGEAELAIILHVRPIWAN
jgi:hypothetical protein